MEEILHQLIGSLPQYLQVFFTSQVVQDFFDKQYLSIFACFMSNPGILQGFRNLVWLSEI